MRKDVLIIAAVLIVPMSLIGCASISKDDCLAGSWADIGYRDGVNGQARGKLADYAKTCGKYNVAPDREAYLSAYRQGIAEYCTYEQGLELGESGAGFNQACSGNLSQGFAQGYDEGRVIYEIHHEHAQLVDDYESVLAELVEVRGRLAGDIVDTDEHGNALELTRNERERLVKSQYRLEGELDDRRRDVREFEHLHGLPRFQF